MNNFYFRLSSLLLLLFPALLPAQSFSSPESVEYDTLNHRWLVGQNGSGQIHVYSPASGTLSSLVSGMSTGPYGIETLNGVVYACDGGSIRGYDLSTGAQTFSLSLGASFLNGLTTDGGHFLFATDFQTKKIYRVNVLTSTYNLMTASALPETPNGIYYDGAGNRLVYVTWGASAKLRALSLADSTVSLLYTTTLSSIDGITRDPATGDWYVAAWSNNALSRIPAALGSNTPVKTGLSSPADIDINLAADSIGIPNSGSQNNVVFYALPTPLAAPAPLTASMEIWPNPAADQVRFSFPQAVTQGTLELLNPAGQLILSQPVHGWQFELSRGNLPAGLYLVRLREGNTLYTQRLTLL